MTTTVSRLMLALAIAGLATLPAVSQAASSVGWQKSLTEVFSAKTSVRAASTGNLLLSGLQVVDGVSLAAGDRVLVKNQTLPAQNGIYIVASGAWTRATDADHWGKFIGANVVVTEGSFNVRSEWLATATAGAGVLDTASLTFAKKAGATTASLAALASSGILVNSAGNVLSRNLVSGSARLSLSNADGVAGNPTLDVVESAIVINNLNGTLSVPKGGTGANTFTTNGVVYGNGTGALQATTAGTSGQLLLANASGVPTFASLSGDGSLAASGVFTLANSGVAAGTYNGSATSNTPVTVDAKGRITAVGAPVVITPAWVNVTGKPTTLAGYGITALDLNAYAPTLTGTGAAGTWGINVTGSATKLATARTISASGDATWSATFDGSGNVTGVLSLADTGVAPGVYGTVDMTPIMTVDATGRLTSIDVVATTVDWGGGVINKPTTLAGYGITAADINTYAPTRTGVGASGTWGISVTGNSGTATKIATARTLSVTGDATWSTTFDGSANATGILTLANSGVVAGTYNNSATTHTPLTVDAKGRVTVAGAAVTITPAWTSITGKPTTIAGYGITPSDLNNYAPALNGVGASGTWGIHITGSAAIANQVFVTDTRASVDTPESYSRGIYFDFKNNTANGLSDGGIYNGVMTFRKWGSGTDWSGGPAHQIGFTENGDLWHRTGSSTAWGGWQELLDSTNVGAYAPSLTGAGASGTWGISVTGSAAKLAAARTLSATGDATWSTTFDGSANATGVLTLANSGVAAGTYGSATTAPVYAVDAKGRITSASNVTITPAWSSVTGRPTTIGGYGITDVNSYAPTMTGGGAYGTWNINVSGSASYVAPLPEYSKSMGDLPTTYPQGITNTFVQGAMGWQSFGTVMTARSYGGGGGTLQMYTPYSPTYGGNSLLVRYGNYDVNGGASWTGWKTLVASDNIGSYAPSFTGAGASGTWGISITGGIEATRPSLGYSLADVNVDYAGQGGPQVRSQGSGAAMMSFHRPGNYAINLGLGTDNQLRVGGWSRGASYVVLDSGNFTGYAPSLTGAGASGTWGINVTGNAATATTASNLVGFTNSNSSNPVSGPDSMTQNGIAYVTGVSLFGQSDGALRTQAYSSAWAGQIFQDYRTGQLAIRGKNSGTWQGWRTVVDSSNISSFAPAYNGAAGALRVTTPSGYVDIGPQNSSWTHFSTDRPGFYFNKDVHVDGQLYKYGGGAYMHSGNAPFAWNMNQYVRSTDSPTFSGLTVTGSLSASGTVTANGGFSGTLLPYYTGGAAGAMTGRSARVGMYNYSTYSDPNTPTTYFTAMGFGNGTGGSAEIGVNWVNSTASGIWFRTLRDCCTNWTGWTQIMTAADHPYASRMNQDVRTDSSPTFQEIYANSWFRSNGSSGWYNQTYGGGIWMQDSSWIRTYGSKNFYVQGGSLLVDGTVYAGGPVQARGGVSNDQGNLTLSASGGTIVANNQLQLAAGASSGAACGVAGAIARDGSNNVYVCK